MHCPFPQSLYIETVEGKIKFTNICLTIYVAGCTWTYEQKADKKI